MVIIAGIREGIFRGGLVVRRFLINFVIQTKLKPDDCYEKDSFYSDCYGGGRGGRR